MLFFGGAAKCSLSEENMAFRLGKAEPLVIVGIVVYVAVNAAQTRAATRLCDHYSVGTQVKDVENLEGTFFLTPMGHLNPNVSTPQNAIFCAPITMCDDIARESVQLRTSAACVAQRAAIIAEAAMK